jgi:hypothetical protein
LSQTIFHLKCQNPTIKEIHFHQLELQKVFSSLFYLLKGHSFIFSQFDVNILQAAIDLIGFNSFTDEIPIPTTYEEILLYLTQPIFFEHRQHFEHSCNFMAENFNLLSPQDFSKLANKSVERILSLDTLRLPSENFLFERILEHPQKYDLMKFIIFPAVDYQHFLNFIQELDFTEAHLELFENLKKIFYFPEENIPKNRWTNIPTILSLEQLNELINILNLFSNENISPINKLKEIIFNYQEFQVQINQLKDHLQSEINDKAKIVESAHELQKELEQSNSKIGELENLLSKERESSQQTQITLKVETPKNNEMIQKVKKLENEHQQHKNHLQSEKNEKSIINERIKNLKK